MTSPLQRIFSIFVPDYIVYHYYQIFQLRAKKEKQKTGVSIDFDILKCYHFSAKFIIAESALGKFEKVLIASDLTARSRMTTE